MKHIFLLSLALLAACTPLPDYPEGVICELTEYRYPEWPADNTQFDGVEFAPWVFDVAVEDYLLSFGMSSGRNWDDVSGGDFNADNVAVSPYARTLNAYSLIAFADPAGEWLDPSHDLNDFGYYRTALQWFTGVVYQRSFKVAADCATPENHTAVTYTRAGSKNDVIVLYEPFFFDRNTVSRAVTIVHEVRHAMGFHHTANSDTCRSCDFQWTDAGANSFAMLYAAALYYAPYNGQPSLTHAHRLEAKRIFYAIRDRAFIVPPKWELEDFKTINHDPEYFVKWAMTFDKDDSPWL